MRQVAQRPRDGRVAVFDAPAPMLRPGWVLVHNRYSLISAGTERAKIELGGKSLLQKARSRPDLEVCPEGLSPSWQARPRRARDVPAPPVLTSRRCRSG